MQLLSLPLETFRAILEVVCEVEYPELIEPRLVNSKVSGYIPHR